MSKVLGPQRGVSPNHIIALLQRWGILATKKIEKLDLHTTAET